jgi:surfeit locus 1 family protein
MPVSLSFKPTLVPTLVAIAGIVMTALLGNWQLNRAAHKADLQTRLQQAARGPAVLIGRDPIDAGSLLYHPVEARGQFDAQRTVYIDNRVHQGTVGYLIASPLRLTRSDRYVLVERGWVAAGPDRKTLPTVVTPPGEVEIKGIATPANPPLFELSQQVQAGNLWQNLTVDRYRQRFGIDLQPIIIQQHNEVPDGLVRDWQPPSLGIERHRGYALQWFAMALAILILYVVLNVRRTRA